LARTPMTVEYTLIYIKLIRHFHYTCSYYSYI